MQRRSISTLLSAALAGGLFVGIAFAGDAPGMKHIFKPPVNVTQALNIRMETKATAELLKKADEQCTDDDCKKQVEECRKALNDCVIVPTKASVRESEVENN